ncbi:MAG TPA: hypothetical protein VIM79_22750, partial [Niastella sp.]
MKYETYSEVNFSKDLSVVNFISKGKNGDIPKRIAFTTTELINVYNLELCNIDEDGEPDDLKMSDNGDRNKILATVYYVVDIYTKKHPERWILFSGNTKGKTRLYRMAIGLHLEELSNKFEIFGFVGENLVLFARNMDVDA